MTPSESLFYYGAGEGPESFSDESHTPTFPDENGDRYTDDEIATCGDDVSCLYDAHETKDLQIGEESLATKTQLLSSLSKLGTSKACYMLLYSCVTCIAMLVAGQSPPSMSGADVISATLGQQVVYKFTVTDNDTFTVSLEGIPPPVEDYSLEQSGNNFTFTWVPKSHATVSLRFVAFDEVDLASQLHPLVRLCACSINKNATCVKANDDGSEKRFILEDCECGTGWGGRLCCIDVDGCLSSTCQSRSSCTDRSITI